MSEGYQVPASAYPPAFPGDPLVTSAVEGFSGWMNRLIHVTKHNWRRILVVTLITYGVPIGVISGVAGALVPRVTSVTNADGTQAPHVDTSHLAVFIVLAVIGAVLGGYLAGVANAAVVWSVTREAAGQPAPLGDAMRYGLRAGLRLWGWSLLYALVILAGTCACLVPGLYCALAGCMYAPVALFDRGANPISTSFSMVNKNFGAALGRMAALVGVVYAAELVISIPAVLVSLANPLAGHILNAVFDIVAAPLAVLITLGTVLLYAELRARLYPTTTATLADSLS